MNNQSNFWRRKRSKHVPASPVGGFPAISAVFLHNCKFDIFEFWTVSGKKKGVTITIILNLIVIGAHCLSLAFHRQTITLHNQKSNHQIHSERKVVSCSPTFFFRHFESKLLAFWKMLLCNSHAPKCLNRFQTQTNL